MARQQKLIHLHGNSDFTQSTVNIDKGEIAVEHGTGAANVKLWTLDETGAKVAFMSSDAVAVAIAAEATRAEAAEKANADAIKTLNGDTGTTGSVDQKVSAAITALDEDLQGQIDELSNKVGATDVAAQIQTAVEAEETARKNADEAEKAAREAADAALQADVDDKVAQATYSEKMTALDQADAANKSAIETEAARAKAAEAAAETNAKDYAKEYADGLNTAMNTRVEALEGDTHTHVNKALLDTYDQTNADIKDAVEKKHAHANKAELDKIVNGDKAKWDAATDAINLFLDDEAVSDEVVNTLKEIQEYITTDGAAANTMMQNIAKNAAAIEAIEADYLKTADKTALQNAIDAKVAKATYDAKVAELVAADAANTKAIDDEVTRAEAAEADLQAAIDAIAGDGGSLADTLQAAKDYTDEVLGGDYTSTNTVAAAIAAEAARAKAAEEANTAAIAAEATRSDGYADQAEADAIAAAKTYTNEVLGGNYTSTNTVTTAINNAIAGIDLTGTDTGANTGLAVTVNIENGKTMTVTVEDSNLIIDCGEY